MDAARAVLETAPKLHKPVFTNWLGAQSAEEARRLFEDARIPTYDTPEKATRGVMHLVRYRKSRETLMEVPPSLPGEFKADVATARRAIGEAISSGREWLDPMDVQSVLAGYGIPVPRTTRVATAEQAAAFAAETGVPVALKIDSPDITHKSDVGGVMLGLNGAEPAREAAEVMLARVARNAPDARIRGFVVQEMIKRPEAYELILGMASDATFGPFVLFGHGGAAVEVIDDKAIGLPPLNLKLAREMMARTRIWNQLKGYRDRLAANLDAIARALVQVSQIVCDFEEVVELDINPLVADQSGVIAVDARIRVERQKEGVDPHHRLAIRPYPSEWERCETVAGFGDYRLRPVRPEDAPAFVEFAAHITPEDMRMRFLAPMRELPPPLLARLTQIDYDREMALVLFDSGDAIAGIARLAADPDGRRAEFAVTVRSDLKGHGIGRLLMDRLIAYARSRGIGELFGDLLAENTAMLALCRDLGCAITAPSRGVVHVTLNI